MSLYSLTMLIGLVLSAPWWLFRMLSTNRYREGLGQRLGFVPSRLLAFVRTKRVAWVHAVSVGEVLAASRMIAELEAALGEDWRVVVSTTTRTGQALAKERLGTERVFYYPIDFASAVRAYLGALRPELLVLIESELWPRMLHECAVAGVPVVVANARVSDRSFARGVKLRFVWGRVLRKVSLWLAQSTEDAQRLTAMGAAPASVKVVGNLKFDILAPRQSRIAKLIQETAAGRPVIVAGSTVDDPNHRLSEEQIVIQAWEGQLRRTLHALLVVAPRHPERFGEVACAVEAFPHLKASAWTEDATHGDGPAREVARDEPLSPFSTPGAVDIILLDTIGDLAAVYSVADVAFVGGSLVARGGHNPLEPAQFGVPVVMGPHFENFRTVVQAMKSADGIRIVADNVGLEIALLDLLTHRDAARSMGERGRMVFHAEQGATLRTTHALVARIEETARASQASTPC